MARYMTAVFVLLLLSLHGNAEENRLSDFDVRYGSQKFPKSQASLHREVIDLRKQAERALMSRVPALRVQYHVLLSGPELVSVNGGRQYLTSPSTDVREVVLRRFLTENALLYGLTEQQIAELKIMADYENPAGNLAWVKLQQVIHGIPVFRGEMRAAFTTKGELVRTVSEFVPDVDYSSLPDTPTITTNQAAQLAAESIGLAEAPSQYSSKLQYFPLKPGILILAWSIIIKKDHFSYYIFINAGTGELLFRKNLTDDQSQPATYEVYDDDSPGPLSPSNATPGSEIQGPGIARTSFSLISELPAFDNLGWIPDGSNTTTGNNVDAGLDLDDDDQIDPAGRAVGSPFRVFSFSYDPPPLGADDPTDLDFRNGTITNAFFWTNRFHDLLYQLGFTEGDGNFQNDNFGRGGEAGDAITAFIQKATNNAFFDTKPDGIPGEMLLGIFNYADPDRDSALDQETIIHELTHGVSRRLHANAAGLNSLQARSMNEGWSDFFARALLSDASEDIHGIFAYGAYHALNRTLLSGVSLGTDNYYYGLRRFPYALKTNLGPNGKPHNPLTFEDIDPFHWNPTDGAFPLSPVLVDSHPSEPHNAGEIWCSALLEVRARLISNLGFGTGNQRMLQLTIDAMKLDPADPSFLNGRDSILAADCAAYNGADETDIWAGFAVRGMGFSAKVSHPFLPNSVTEAFDMPNVAIGDVQFSEPKTSTGVCQNGFADPGEKLDLVVPYTNPLCVQNITQVVANIAGNPGPAKNYGTIAAGVTTSRTFNYKVPAGAVCGDELEVTINAKSNLGTISNQIPLQIGKPVIIFAENFDGVIPPALPAGWTTSSSWVTSTAESNSAPNALFGPEADDIANGAVTSPAILINTANARLTFNHHVNILHFSSAILEVSIGGGSFENIKAAGGIFLTGPYNDTNSSSWKGNSHGFIATTVKLPESVSGQTVQFRWKISSTADSSDLVGWFIDDVQVIDGYTCCP